MESVSLLLLCCCCERQSLPDLLFFFPQFSSLWSVRGPPVSASVFLQLEPMRLLLQHSIESRWKPSYQSAAAAAASVTLTDRGRSFVLYFTPPFFHFCFFFPGVIIISIFHLPPPSLLTSPVIQRLHLRQPMRTVFNKSWEKKGKTTALTPSSAHAFRLKSRSREKTKMAGLDAYATYQTPQWLVGQMKFLFLTLYSRMRRWRVDLDHFGLRTNFGTFSSILISHSRSNCNLACNS